MMISLKIVRPSVNQRLLKKTLLRLYSTSVEPVRKPNEEYYGKELKQFETLTNISKKVRDRKPQREPFVKNLLLGNFDTEILAFPQMEISEVTDVEMDTKNVEKLLKQRHMVDVDKISDKSFRQNLSDHRLIGLQAPQLMDGRESTPLQVMRYLETYSIHKLRDSLIHHEMLGVQTLVRYADDTLKKKYLHPLMKGEKVAAFCMIEPKLTDIESFKTTAELSPDKKHWVLNGTKSLVVNGLSADYLIVFAASEFRKKDDEKAARISAFLVEKDTTGVSWKKLEPADTELAEIVFNDVEVPLENVIGDVHTGDKILAPILSDFRLSSGPACIALTKDMLNNLHKTIVDASTEEVNLSGTEALQSRLGEIAMNLYAAESVTYLTAGLQDSYDDQDVVVESAIVKVLSSEVAYNTSGTCLDISGSPATLKDHWARIAHENTINYLTLYETNDNLRMCIALLGLQHAGVTIQETVKKLRNPFFNAAYMMKRMFTEKRNHIDDPKLNLGLDSYLHPSLVGPSKQLEYCVKRLQFATERVLVNYGLECVNKHVDLRRLADIMIDCYAMTAVLARASRAYCVGLQFSDYDMILANSFCNLAKARVKANVLAIYVTDYGINEGNYIAFSKQLTKRKEYFIESPIRRFI